MTVTTIIDIDRTQNKTEWQPEKLVLRTREHWRKTGTSNLINITFMIKVVRIASRKLA